MSADLLRSRLTEDCSREANTQAEVLVGARQMSLDELRYLQGMIAGLRLAVQLLDDRYKNLHAIG